MLRNYFTVAVRNLVNHKLYSLINIGGLTVGLAACLLILLFVHDERSFDRWVPNADRIAAIESTFFVPGREPLEFAGTPGPLAEPLRREFSSDIEEVVRVLHSEEPVRVGDRQFLDDFTYVDRGFFTVFDLPVSEGVREQALADSRSILLSRTTARKYFGDQPAVGNTITVANDVVYTVVGVFPDLPRNTHLVIDSIALLDEERYREQPWVVQEWTSVNVRGYVLFRSPAARARVAAAMPPLLDRVVDLKLPGVTKKPSELLRFDFQPILDIHLHADKPGYARTGSFTAVVAFAGIALLILIIACINFVNLATARAMKRAREVAMRKVVGATRRQLVVQHLGEAVLTALVALVFALAIVEVALPAFNQLLGKDLRLDLTGDPTVLATALGLVVVVGVIGGLYPAIYLSRFRPAAVLKANQSSVHGSSRLRTALVVFQFAVSIALIACTATIYVQTVYARTLERGFDSEARVVLSGIGDVPSKEAAPTLKREIGALPGVLGVSLSADTPPLHHNNNTLLYQTPVPGELELLIETQRVDPDYFAVYGIRPLAGRGFSEDRPSDFRPLDPETDVVRKQSVVINLAFMRKLGFTRPEDVLGTVLYEPVREGGPPMVTTVIGVVPDLQLRSARDVVTPLLYFGGGSDRQWGRLTVHLDPATARETMRAIEQVWARVAPTVPIRTAYVHDELMAQHDKDEQRAKIFAGFAVFAVLIACLGLFGLASFAAERRTKEIGMRKVLGASVLDIVRLLVWQFSRPVLVANLIAWPVAFYLMDRWLDGFRRAISLTDPRVLVGIFGGAAVLALLIAWLTVAGHAYRVARANPGRALRVE